MENNIVIEILKHLKDNDPYLKQVPEYALNRIHLKMSNKI